MSQFSLFMDKPRTLVNLIWTVADQALRGPFQPREYQDVILPMTVLRRIDCAMRDTQEEVRKTHAQLKDRFDRERIAPFLTNASGFPFYNTSQFDFQRLIEDPINIVDNVLAYVNAFSPDMLEVLEAYQFRNTLQRLARANITFLVFQRFSEVDLHQDSLSNHDMGYVFEELIRKFNEETNESPGEHYTPREIVRLMTDLMIAPDAELLGKPGLIRQLLDPCCGTGGMLTICRNRILQENPEAIVEIYGQELNDKTYAIAKSDLMISSTDAKDIGRIRLGNTLSEDRFSGETYHYMLANPPYGVDWSAAKTEVEEEHSRGEAGRFAPGLPRKSDGQTLFMLHMLSKMKPLSEGGSRVSIIMNGSPLFSGGANSGESEIRRYVLENDLLEAIIALPGQIFYNTGIATYIWVLTNRKEARRKDKVQLIDASGESFWKPMRKSLGDKRREMDEGHLAKVMEIYASFEEDSDVSKVYLAEHFGYRRVTVDRPLQLDFATSEERMGRLNDQRAFQKMEENEQDTIRRILDEMTNDHWTDRSDFLEELNREAGENGMKLNAAITKAIVNALGERNPEASVCMDRKGNPEHDTGLRDTERVPLDVPIPAYMEKEVWPFVPDAWVSNTVTDMRDGETGKVGYEIPFTRYFYVYSPPRPLEEIEAEIKRLQAEIVEQMSRLFDE